MWNRNLWLTLVVVAVMVRWVYAVYFIYPTISGKSVVALRSHNTDVVGLALFSSETQADIDALTPAYTNMRIRDVVILPLSGIAPWVWVNHILLTGY